MVDVCLVVSMSDVLFPALVVKSPDVSAVLGAGRPGSKVSLQPTKCRQPRVPRNQV